jgi:hypothetical protein
MQAVIIGLMTPASTPFFLCANQRNAPPTSLAIPVPHETGKSSDHLLRPKRAPYSKF